MGALAASLIFGAILLSRPANTERGAVVRSQIVFAGLPLRLGGTHAFALNPAGTEIVFSRVQLYLADQFQLMRRSLSEDAAVPIAGTEGASEPFFSPDGQWLAFIQNSRWPAHARGGRRGHRSRGNRRLAGWQLCS